MKYTVVHYGLTVEQASFLVAVLPEEYELITAECVTDLIVSDATCTIVDASQINSGAMNTLLVYYLDAGDLLGETVVWLGDADLPDLPSFVQCSCFLNLLTDLDSILMQTKSRYSTMQLYNGSRKVYDKLPPLELAGDKQTAGEKGDSHRLDKCVYSAGQRKNVSVSLSKPVTVYGLKHPSQGFSFRKYQEVLKSILNR